MKKKKLAIIGISFLLAAAPVASFARVPSYSSSDDHDDSSSSNDSSSTTNNTGVTSQTITAGAGQSQTTQPAANAQAQANAQAVANAQPSQSVTVTVGGTSVESTVVGPGAASVTGNTVVEPKAAVTVATPNGGVAVVASSAINAAGVSRALLAEPTVGATVQTVTVTTAEGTTVTRQAVVYADGTQVLQRTGTDELTGFAAAIAAAEQAINAGTQSVAAAYNSQVADVDLNQYAQVGAAVAYEVIPAAGATAARTQVEKVDLPAGSQVVVLVTDANGNVSHSIQTVGANGIIQYEIPGANCIVRLMAQK